MKQFDGVVNDGGYCGGDIVVGVVMISVVMVSLMVVFIVKGIIEHRKPKGGADETTGTSRPSYDENGGCD